MSSNVYRSYTGAEQRSRARLILRGLKQSIAGSDAIDPRIEQRLDAIDARAEDRGARLATALYRQDEQARDALATAQAREGAARGTDRAAARAARKAAEQRVKDTRNAILRAGL